MQKRVQVWRRSTGERLPDPLPEGLLKFNPDLTTEKPANEKVEGCCGEGLVDLEGAEPAAEPVKKSTSGRKKEKSNGSTS